MSAWISRNQIIKRIREANWSHSSQTQRVEIFKLKGSAQRMNVHHRDFFPESQVRVILKTAGLTREQTEDFLKKAVKK